MQPTLHAFWRRIDQPGHDAARLEETPTGWRLEGYAAFRENGDTGLRYRVDLASDWSTVSAIIEGHRGGVPIRHEFAREREWLLDGQPAAGLSDLVHLDFGFTPSTNLQQLRHARLEVGEEAEISAAWFDIGQSTLTRLPQRYHRIAQDRYGYCSPMGGYEAVLEISGNGFVRLYPGLWEMEP